MVAWAVTGVAQRAHAFAMHCHANQKRKYTGEPYVIHCVEVARLVAHAGYDEEVVAAAYLHDTVEDGHTTLDAINAWFGLKVSVLVNELTDVSKPTDGNRAARRAIDRAKLSRASPEGQSVKLADLIDNTRCIVDNDRDFARVYLHEKRLLLGVLTKGHAGLMTLAQRTLLAAEAALNEGEK